MDRFAEHRRRLAEVVGPDGIAVVPAALPAIRNHDVEHHFRQDSDFFYLTGFQEPEAVAVIAPGHPDGEFTLFVRPRDRQQEIWNGYRAGVEGAKERFAADAAYPVGQLDEVLPRLAAGRGVLFYRLGNPHHDQRITALVERMRSYQERWGLPSLEAVRDVGRVLAEMRIRKSPSEIESLRAACDLSVEGHREAMRFARPGLYEYQVQAAMEYVWREGGSPRNGYGSIVASGPNACILHYVENDREIEDGDLILIDAAAEVDYFSSDITRTFPANGSFTSPQMAIYEVVLAAQRQALAVCRPGSSIRQVHDRAVEVLTEGLVELGLLPRGVEDSLAMHHYQEFFMHGTSHWLGMDVHDAGSYRAEGKPRVLEPGMVFTVEPGLYVAADRPEVELALLEFDRDEWLERRLLDPAGAKQAEEEAKEAAEKVTHRVPEDFLGIGVRIEDDVLITEEGHENLTAAVPSHPPEVEALCSEQSWLFGCRP